MKSEDEKPFRVLCLDGGGMRGLYSATLLDTLIKRVNDSSFVADAGKAFDLIVGTSTGGILAIGLAYGLPLKKIIELYTLEGSNIFPNPTPSPTKLGGFLIWSMKRKKASQEGQQALRKALEEQFGNATVKQLYDGRNIAVCIPAIRMATRKAWVFKTPHIPARENHHAKNRDDNYKLADVCLATSAAPLVLPLVAIDNPDDGDNNEHQSRYDVFSDGGLWANNPTLIGLIEALEITQSKRHIEIISISTASPPSGKVIEKEKLNFGLLDWKGGVGALETSLDAQASGTQFMAKFLKPHLKADVDIVRLAYDAPSSEQANYVGLDKSDKNAVKVLMDMAKSDAENNILGIDKRHSDQEINILTDIIKSMPAINNEMAR